jgi:hypothetical protein
VLCHAKASYACRMNDLAKSIAATILKLRDQSGAKAAFEAAVRNFEKAKENGDINQLNHNVIPTFPEIANGNGMYADPAKKYLQSTIPNAIPQLKKMFAGKAVVPPIECRGHGLQVSLRDAKRWSNERN